MASSDGIDRKSVHHTSSKCMISTCIAFLLLTSDDVVLENGVLCFNCEISAAHSIDLIALLTTL